jgi:hypothetical protein
MAIVLVRHYCPCCGYDGLEGPAYAELGAPPWLHLEGPPYFPHPGFPSYEVCACCGFEFGNDDDPGTAPGDSFEDYRRQWVASGAEWFDPTKQPKDWDLAKQLWRAGIPAF